MFLQSVLVEYEDIIEKKIYANSGCLFSNKYVLITSNLLATLLTKQNNIKIELDTLKSGLSPPEILLKSSPNVNIIINAENPYLCVAGKVVAIYVSDLVRKQIEKFFIDWSIDEQNKTEQLKELLSLFFIIRLNDTPGQIDNEDLIKCLREICIQSEKTEIYVGAKLIIEGTPFGNRHFLRSRSRGIISNIFGTGQCFILTDTPTAPGSEGSPIYLKSKSEKMLPVGIVLASLSWWKGEWIGLTLGVRITSVFSEVLQNCSTIASRTLQDTKLNAVQDVMNYSVVQVLSGSSWGSAILLDKENGIFITNSHVLETNSPVLVWKCAEMKSHVAYKAAQNETYDVAILIADVDILSKTSMQTIKVSKDQVILGQTVFSVGYPLFPKALQPTPTVTKGIISHVTPNMIKTSSTVLPGSSGGAIILKTGELVGVIVCNARINDDFSAVPRVNMAIPIINVMDIVEDYARCKDDTILRKLKVENLRAKKDWNLLSSHL